MGGFWLGLPGGHGSGAGGPCQRRGAEGVRIYFRPAWQLQARRRDAGDARVPFGDLSGAYGAYSFYRQNGWPKESIGTGAASNHNRVIFWQGTTLVDATFSQVGPMSAGELREIARQLPDSRGSQGVHRPFWPACPKPRWTARRRITRWDRQATREQEACCRRRWSTSTRAQRR